MAKCTDSFSFGLSHTKKLLLDPFRLGYWIKMAVLLYTVQGINSLIQAAYQFSLLDQLQKFTPEALSQSIPLLIFIVGSMMVFGVLVLIISSAIGIVFYDGVYSNPPNLLESFTKYFSEIISYCIWNAAVMICFSFLLIIIVVAAALLLGGFAALGDSTSASILFIFLGVLLAIGLFIIAALYYQILNSLVLPQMIVKRKGIFAAWSEAFKVIGRNFGEFTGFFLIQLMVGILFGIIIFSCLFLVNILLAFTGLAPYIQTIFIQPFVLLVTFFFLPISIFVTAYSLCFNAAIYNDPDFEPNSGFKVIPKAGPVERNNEQTAMESSFYPPAWTGELSGAQPIHFRDIPIENGNTHPETLVSGVCGIQDQTEESVDLAMTENSAAETQLPEVSIQETLLSNSATMETSESPISEGDIQTSDTAVTEEQQGTKDKPDGV